MSYNDYNSQNQNEEKEEIRFDDRDFQNPYSGYYREPAYNNFGSDFKVYEEPSYTYAPLIDEEKEKHNLSKIGFGYALFTAISFAASLVIQIIVYLINPEFYESTLFLNIVTPASLYLFALPVLLIMLSKCEAKPPEKRKMSFGVFILFVITAFGFMYIGAIIGDSVMSMLSMLVGYDYSNGLQAIIDYDNLWVTAIFTVIVAPIGEEFVFRKLIIDRTRKYGGFVSVGLSGLVFGLMHGNLYQFFYCFALGLLLGYIYYSTGKLYITIAIHAIVNFTGSILTAMLTPVSEALEKIDPLDTETYLAFIEANLGPVLGLLALGLFSYAAMACAVIFPIVFRKKIRLEPGEAFIPKKKIMPIVILNAGIITMIILYLIEFGLNLLPL